MGKRPTVLLLIPHLGGGGAERVTALLARGLSATKFDLHLGLVTPAQIGNEPLPSSIAIHDLGAKRMRSAGFRLLRLIHELKPDAILSSMAHLNFLVLLLRPFLPRKTRILIRQNGMVGSKERSPRLTRLLYKLLYARSDCIICQTNAMATEMAVLSGSPQKLQVLSNPVDIDSIRASADHDSTQYAGPGPHLLAVGRLSREKGFDLLLHAFATTRANFPTAHLTLIGVGPEKLALQALSRTLALESAVRFVGSVPHPEAWFRGATIFVLSSRHEGLPNALLEAAAGGLPIVALPARGGLVDLLEGRAGVWLAPEISAHALEVSLCAALRVLQPGERFAHAWIEQFRMSHVIQLYEELIDTTLAGWQQ